MTLMLRTAALSDPGLVRANNEDAAYAGARLAAVADGIGGQPAGEVASDIVVRALAALDSAPVAADPAGALYDAVNAANQEIRAATAADAASDGMGTTVTAALLHGDQLAVIHVGDSRGYLLRDGLLFQITRDDTFVQALVDKGVLSAEEARAHPQRSLVTNAIQGDHMSPNLGMVAVQAGDRLLLCSDGLSDVVTDEVIAQVLTAYTDRQECTEHLVKLAHQAGAPDNVTVVVADITGSGTGQAG
ncbi:MAG TPA: protein phosphatase 2C domain-containing protein [Micromonosporaceae bacterium]|nr:protein phosphatase 2C domain-containing protein [Micromonosporaceae bacterium]